MFCAQLLRNDMDFFFVSTRALFWLGVSFQLPRRRPLGKSMTSTLCIQFISISLFGTNLPIFVCCHRGFVNGMDTASTRSLKRISAQREKFISCASARSLSTIRPFDVWQLRADAVAGWHGMTSYMQHKEMDEQRSKNRCKQRKVYRERIPISFPPRAAIDHACAALCRYSWCLLACTLLFLSFVVLVLSSARTRHQMPSHKIHISSCVSFFAYPLSLVLSLSLALNSCFVPPVFICALSFVQILATNITNTHDAQSFAADRIVQACIHLLLLRQAQSQS